MVYFSASRMMLDTTKDHPKAAPMPISWYSTCSTRVTSASSAPNPTPTNKPVASAPQMPPIPCMPNTSSESSIRSLWISSTAAKHTAPAPAPMMMAGITPTKPAAGVIATSPATAPAAAPLADGRRVKNHDTTDQDDIAVAAAALVTTKALAASPLDRLKLLPALKPNQPNHSSPAPSSTSGTLSGVKATDPNPVRRPTINAAANAAVPEAICTTVPPAKSSANPASLIPSSGPRLPSQPPPHTQWHSGA